MKRHGDADGETGERDVPIPQQVCPMLSLYIYLSIYIYLSMSIYLYT